MNTNTQFSVKWYRSPLQPELLEELNTRDDLKGFIQTLGHLSIIAITFSFTLFAVLNLTWQWVLLGIFFHGVVTEFSINAVHELVHKTVFKTKWLNTFFSYVYGFIGWIHPHYFWNSHSEHHKFTMHPPHDMEVLGSEQLTFKGFLRKIIFDPVVAFGPLRGDMCFIRGNLSYAFGQFTEEGWEGILLAKNVGAKRKIIIWARTLLIGHGLITAVSLYNGYWIIPILTSLTPVYGGLFLYLTNTLQHAGLPGNVKDFRLNCRTIYLNPVLEFLYWHMNYHIEHHMYTAVPCYNLKRLHNAIKDDLPPINKNLFRAWQEQIAIQYNLMHDADYRFIQSLPSEGLFDRKKKVDVTNLVVPGDKNRFHSNVLSNVVEAEQLNERCEAISKSKPLLNQDYQVWECSVCGFLYDEALGMPEEGISSGTLWKDISDDWMCPECGVSKADFEMVNVSGSR